MLYYPYPDFCLGILHQVLTRPLGYAPEQKDLIKLPGELEIGTRVRVFKERNAKVGRGIEKTLDSASKMRLFRKVGLGAVDSQ